MMFIVRYIADILWEEQSNLNTPDLPGAIATSKTKLISEKNILMQFSFTPKV